MPAESQGVPMKRPSSIVDIADEITVTLGAGNDAEPTPFGDGEPLAVEETSDAVCVADSVLPFRPSTTPPPLPLADDISEPRREQSQSFHETGPLHIPMSPVLPFAAGPDPETRAGWGVHPLPWPSPPPRTGSLPLVRPPNPLASAGYGTHAQPAAPAAVEPDQDQEAEPEPEPEPEHETDEHRRLDEVTLELCASLRAAIDTHPELRDELLADERLDVETWEAAETQWHDAVAKAIHKGDRERVESFDDAYVARIERQRGPIDVETFSRLELAIERGYVDGVIVDLGIPKPAVIRLKRVWTRRTLVDRELREEVRRTIQQLRKLKM